MPTQFFNHHLVAIPLIAFTLLATACATTPDYKSVDPGAAANMIDENEEVVVLDIRTPEEYAEGHIEGSVNIDFKAKDFGERIVKLDRDTTYIVHCRSGARSTASLASFRKLSFPNIYHLDVGMNGWVDAGKPVRK